MIILRKKTKTFTVPFKPRTANIGPNSFGIAPDDIIEKGPKPSPNPFTEYNVIWTENANDNYSQCLLDNYYSPQDINRIDKIIALIKKNPYASGPNSLKYCYGIHPLWRFEDKKNRFTIWAADITKKDRLVYLVFKSQNSIIVINCKGHSIGDLGYGEKRT